MARAVGQGVGIELSSNAVECARIAAARNHFENLTFESCDAAQWLAGIAPGSFDCLMVNPPRRGLGGALIDSVRRLNLSTIFYSSCNPRTLLEDLEGLASDYRVEEFRCFDMFPLTDHMEVFAVLQATPFV